MNEPLLTLGQKKKCPASPGHLSLLSVPQTLEYGGYQYYYLIISLALLLFVKKFYLNELLFYFNVVKTEVLYQCPK